MIIILCLIGYVAVAGLISFFWEEHQNYYRAHWWEDLGGFFLVLGWAVVLPLVGMFAVGRLIAYFFQYLFDKHKIRKRRRR